jgi:hypothetical protein
MKVTDAFAKHSYAKSAYALYNAAVRLEYHESYTIFPIRHRYVSLLNAEKKKHGTGS